MIKVEAVYRYTTTYIFDDVVIDMSEEEWDELSDTEKEDMINDQISPDDWDAYASDQEGGMDDWYEIDG